MSFVIDSLQTSVSIECGICELCDRFKVEVCSFVCVCVCGGTKQIERGGVWEGESREVRAREREGEMVVLTSVMAPIIPVPLHAVAPQVQAQKSPTPSSICKLSPRAMASAAAKPENGNNSSNNLNNNGVPKMEPFSRSRISRLMREPSLLEKAEHALGGMYYTHLSRHSCVENKLNHMHKD